jgi:hypothetical protein
MLLLLCSKGEECSNSAALLLLLKVLTHSLTLISWQQQRCSSAERPTNSFQPAKLANSFFIIKLFAAASIKVRPAVNNAMGRPASDQFITTDHSPTGGGGGTVRAKTRRHSPLLFSRRTRKSQDCTTTITTITPICRSRGAAGGRDVITPHNQLRVCDGPLVHSGHLICCVQALILPFFLFFVSASKGPSSAVVQPAANHQPTNQVTIYKRKLNTTEDWNTTPPPSSYVRSTQLLYLLAATPPLHYTTFSSPFSIQYILFSPFYPSSTVIIIIVVVVVVGILLARGSIHMCVCTPFVQLLQAEEPVCDGDSSSMPFVIYIMKNDGGKRTLSE